MLIVPVFSIIAFNYLAQLIKLGHIWESREEHKLIAARFLVATDEASYGLWSGKETCGDALGKGAGEGVILFEVTCARLGDILAAQGKVTLRPQLRLARTPGI